MAAVRAAPAPALTGSGAACLLLLCLSLAADAQARTSCSYTGPPTNQLTVRASGMARPEIRRAGDEIVVAELVRGPRPCTGGVPTVLNTDTITVLTRGVPTVALELSGGPFSPGATSEPEGASEIEVEFRGRALVGSVVGTPGADEFHWGAGGAHAGLNLNPLARRTDFDLTGDLDVDVTVSGAFSSLVPHGGPGNDTIFREIRTPVPEAVIEDGGRGNDFLIAPDRQRGLLNGGSGNDSLVGGGEGDLLRGGPGNDSIEGAGGDDRIRGGRGKDVLRGGGGNDTIYALDSQRENIGCGPGRDRLTADRGDRLRDCELISRR